MKMYFYSLRTLLIYQYEIKYQLEEGIWSTRSFNLNNEPWINAELLLTKGKSNVRTEVSSDVTDINGNYNLKMTLNTSTSKSRIHGIGLVTNALLLDDTTLIKELLDAEIHEAFDMIEEIIEEMKEGDYDIDDCYSRLIAELQSNSYGRLAELIDSETLLKLTEASYSDIDMRDDLGMIQNTMRNIVKI
jgi:hypothetical protein